MRERFQKLLSEEKRHLKRLKEAYETLGSLGYSLPLSGEDVRELLTSREGTMALDQIAYRFSKLQDSLGKLLKTSLFLLGENVEHLPMVDVVNTAEKLGFPVSEEKWFELRSLRNLIAHEYEEETDKIAELINGIYRELNYLEDLIQYVEGRTK